MSIPSPLTCPNCLVKAEGHLTHDSVEAVAACNQCMGKCCSWCGSSMILSPEAIKELKEQAERKKNAPLPKQPYTAPPKQSYTASTYTQYSSTATTFSNLTFT